MYPIISSYKQQRYQSNAVATYKSNVQDESDDLDTMLEDAKEYNNMLYQSKGAIVDNMDSSVLSDENYETLLNISSGVMGSIEIPKIAVDLPIYHGTSDEVLSKGVGHIQGTSLPIGGTSTHSVLSGHRGLPGSKLFTRLDEIEEGDLFFISVLNETLAYKVCSIQIVEPDDTSVFNIEADVDKVSLVTCTPYGLNTHRLIVTGERVDYETTEYDSIKAVMPSWREMLFTALPFIFIGILGVSKFVEWRKSKHVKESTEVKS